MTNKTIKQILMERDGMTEQQAEDLIESARDDLLRRAGNGEVPMDICEEWFGLEPDYIHELMP